MFGRTNAEKKANLIKFLKDNPADYNSINKMADHFKVEQTTIRFWINKADIEIQSALTAAKQDANELNRKKLDNNQVITREFQNKDREEIFKKLLELIKQNPYMNYRELSQLLSKQVSETTVYNWMNERISEVAEARSSTKNVNTQTNESNNENNNNQQSEESDSDETESEVKRPKLSHSQLFSGQQISKPMAVANLLGDDKPLEEFSENKLAEETSEIKFNFTFHKKK